MTSLMPGTLRRVRRRVRACAVGMPIQDAAAEREWLEEALGASSAQKLLGTARPGVHLRPYAHDSLLLLWEYWHGDWLIDEWAPPLDPEFDTEMFPEVCLRGLASFIPGGPAGRSAPQAERLTHPPRPALGQALSY